MISANICILAQVDINPFCEEKLMCAWSLLVNIFMDWLQPTNIQNQIWLLLSILKILVKLANNVHLKIWLIPLFDTF